eukprot:TRINITY_DN11821_c0_g1_i3.p2 TRINITY_DN11821_c0_g1~~TRINITY_DN11821_c0_g1_i3.p2  ORF type:complete len:156 (-),score=42.23 TRINITY_DN11821_c0_g1_i3:233-700(-)
MLRSLVGSEMCIRDRLGAAVRSGSECFGDGELAVVGIRLREFDPDDMEPPCEGLHEPGYGAAFKRELVAAQTILTRSDGPSAARQAARQDLSGDMYPQSPSNSLLEEGVNRRMTNASKIGEFRIARSSTKRSCARFSPQSSMKIEHTFKSTNFRL